MPAKKATEKTAAKAKKNATKKAPAKKKTTRVKKVKTMNAAYADIESS